jgi:hypothetical protein
MTEVEWAASTDPESMLEFLRGKSPIRKFRLFAVACCRRICPLILQTERGYRGVVLTERMADGLPVTGDLEELRGGLWYEGFSRIDGYSKRRVDNILYHAAFAALSGLEDESLFLEKASDYLSGNPDLLSVSMHAAWAMAHSCRMNDAHEAKPEAAQGELTEHVRLVHDIFGNPPGIPPSEGSSHESLSARCPAGPPTSWLR